MAKTIGRDARLYYNIGGHGVGTWLELARVKDVNVPMTKTEADTTTRSSGRFDTQTSGGKQFEYTFEIAWNPGDAGFDAVRDAWLNDTVLGLHAVDAALGEGPRADCEVFGFSLNQLLNEEPSVSVSAKPTDSDTTPSWEDEP